MRRGSVNQRLENLDSGLNSNVLSAENGLRVELNISGQNGILARLLPFDERIGSPGVLRKSLESTIWPYSNGDDANAEINLSMRSQSEFQLWRKIQSW